ncbi:helix-turn-helix transcriptional regulator [Chromobacterium piscinae]
MSGFMAASLDLERRIMTINRLAGYWRRGGRRVVNVESRVRYPARNLPMQSSCRRALHRFGVQPNQKQPDRGSGWLLAFVEQGLQHAGEQGKGLVHPFIQWLQQFLDAAGRQAHIVSVGCNTRPETCQCNRLPAGHCTALVYRQIKNSQTAAAVGCWLTGMSRTYVSEIERGERNVSIDNMGALADALGVELRDLVDPEMFGGLLDKANK